MLRYEQWPSVASVWGRIRGLKWTRSHMTGGFPDEVPGLSRRDFAHSSLVICVHIGSNFSSLDRN